MLLCRYATKKSKIACSDITVLWGGCFVCRLYRSPYNSRGRRINCAELAHSCAEARFLASPELFPKKNLASACLNHSNVMLTEVVLDEDKNFFERKIDINSVEREAKAKEERLKAELTSFVECMRGKFPKT